MSGEAQWKAGSFALMAINCFAFLCLRSSGQTAWLAQAAGLQTDAAAISYFTAALRGAKTKNGDLSHNFRRLAELHYEARMLRRQREWNGAVKIYRKAIALHECVTVASDGVSSTAVVACSWLNLALTEKEFSQERARRSFQDGVQMLQQIMTRELHMVMRSGERQKPRIQWLAGKSRRGVANRGAHQIACKWLATLFVSWGLLEIQYGRPDIASRLLLRAAFLDGRKKKVLSWRIVTESLDDATKRHIAHKGPQTPPTARNP